MFTTEDTEDTEFHKGKSKRSSYSPFAGPIFSEVVHNDEVSPVEPNIYNII